MNRMSVLSLLAIIALLSTGCASSGQSSGQTDNSRDLAEMKERILELQEQAAVTDVEMDRLRAQVSNLEKSLAGGATPNPSQPAATIGSSPTPVQAPSAMGNTSGASIEETDLEPAPVSSAAAISSGDPESGPSSEIQTPEAAGTPTEVAQQPVEPAAQALYDRGYTLYHQGKYLDAEASFQRFLQAYPATELSDNAQFWIGESRFARGDIRGALAAFREVLQKYPNGNKVPDALIKEGDCLEKLGDRDGARDRYNEVRRRFPDSGAAVMAEDRLSDLDG